MFDKTASRHRTDAKSPASFLVVDTDENGRVRKILPIADWFRRHNLGVPTPPNFLTPRRLEERRALGFDP